MAIKKQSEGRPQISQVSPAAAIAGGELAIHGKGFLKSERPLVKIGDISAPIVIGSDSLVIVRVPEGASEGGLIVENAGHSSKVWECDIGIQIAEICTRWPARPLIGWAISSARSAALAGRRCQWPFIASTCTTT